MLKKYFHFLFKDFWFYLEINFFVILAVALVAAALFFQLIFVGSTSKATQIGFSLFNADYLLVPKGKTKEITKTITTGEPVKFYFSDRVLEKIKKVSGVEKVAPLLILESASASCCTAGYVLLVGFDPEVDFSLNPWLKKVLRGEVKEDEVIVGDNVKRPLGLNIRFYNHRFKVKGSLEPLGLGFYDNGVFMRLEDAYQMAEETRFKKFTRRLEINRGDISAIVIQQKPGVSRESLKLTVKKELPTFDLLELSPVAASARKRASKLVSILSFYVILLSLVLLLILSLIFYLQLRRRERTIGLLEAVGASRKLVYLMVLSEAGLIGIIGAVFGVLVGWLIIASFSLYITHQLELPFVFPDFLSLFKSSFFVVLVFTFVSILGSLYALSYLARQEPYQIIREGKNG